MVKQLPDYAFKKTDRKVTKVVLHFQQRIEEGNRLSENLIC